jgi:hypothetical protein
VTCHWSATYSSWIIFNSANFHEFKSSFDNYADNYTAYSMSFLCYKFAANCMTSKCQIEEFSVLNNPFWRSLITWWSHFPDFIISDYKMSNWGIFHRSWLYLFTFRISCWSLRRIFVLLCAGSTWFLTITYWLTDLADGRCFLCGIKFALTSLFAWIGMWTNGGLLWAR